MFRGHLKSLSVGSREVLSTVSTVVSMTPVGTSTQRSIIVSLRTCSIYIFCGRRVNDRRLHVHKMKMSAMPSSSELIGMPHTAHVMHAMHARATMRGKKYTYVAIDRDTCTYHTYIHTGTLDVLWLPFSFL